MTPGPGPALASAPRRGAGRGEGPGRATLLGLALWLSSTPIHAATPATPPRIALDGVSAGARTGDLRRYTFAPGPHPQLRIALGTAWDGRPELRVPLQNAMPWAVTLTIAIEGTGGEALHATVGVPAGPPQTLVLPLHPASPRDAGMQAGPPMPVTRGALRLLVATTLEGTPVAHPRAITLGIPAPQAAQTLLLGRPAPGEEDTLRAVYTGIVDAYGQFTGAAWPEKIADTAALRAGHRREEAALGAAKTPPGRDRYGGRLAVAWRATGWFRVGKHDGRWSLVTPDGHPFFSLGVNAVTADGGRTYVQGREWMFRDLPAADGPLGRFYGWGDSRAATGAASGMAFDHGRWFDVYAANLYRIDGARWKAAWRVRTRRRLAAWGFNTLGNWSDEQVARGHGLAYTRSINVAGIFADVATGYDYWGRMPDPFDPRFAAAARQAVARATAGVRDDPWLLGYFIDNELAWAGQGPQGRWALALGTLRGTPASPAKQAWLAQLKQRYGSAAALGKAWGIAPAGWDTLAAEGFKAPLPAEAHPAIARDYSAWLQRYAEAYFRTIAQALHRADPHHLLLGGRMAVQTPEAVAASARWCDVLSFNDYADLPQHGLDLAALHSLDKPVLLSEFAFGSTDRGPFGTGPVAVWTEAQRGQAYVRYVQAAAADPSVVGAHWFQYADEPVTGRLLDGENAHLGLVGITDVPCDIVVPMSKANDSALGQR